MRIFVVVRLGLTTGRCGKYVAGPGAPSVSTFSKCERLLHKKSD